MADNKINVGGRLHSIATGNILAGADEILDDSKGKKQSEINIDVDNALADRYTKDESYSKTQLNSLITTPDVQYITAVATEQTTVITDILPSVGTANTIYRVGKWNGTQYNAVVYSEYAWDGSAYVLLDVKEYGIDDEPISGSNNLITSGAVYNETKKSDVILAVDKTDLARGYYYNNTTGEKVANQNCLSKLMDIPTNTKEINVIFGGISSTVVFYGIAIYDAAIVELTDENISDHFITGFTCKDILEVSRIIVNNTYKSIAVTIGPPNSLQVLFNALESCVHYGSRLLDVFYLNDSSARSMKGKSLYLKTLDKTTGIVSFRDPVTLTDYNVTSTIKKGKELLLSKNNNYIYLGVLVDWDILDYNFSNIVQTADNTFVLSTPKTAEGQKFFDMIYSKKYHQTGNTTVNEDGVVSGFDCVWEDGTPGHVAYNTFDSNVLEYKSSIVTYGTSYAIYYGLKTFDEYGNITSETGLEIRIV